MSHYLGQRCKSVHISCEKMLQNGPLIAKIGFDTAENGPSKVWDTGISSGIPVRAPLVPVKPIPSGRHACAHSASAPDDIFALIAGERSYELVAPPERTL